MKHGIPLHAKLAMIIVQLVLCGLIIGVCISRIKEIQGAEVMAYDTAVKFR